jgi:hypothetical protein
MWPNIIGDLCDEITNQGITGSIRTQQRGSISMNTLKLLAIALTLTFGATALADVEEHREIKVVIEGQSTDGGTAFSWTSDHPGFDMENMQVGETQSIIDESGKSVLITREADGFRFDVDGESIKMPDMGSMDMSSMGMGPHAASIAIMDVSNMATDIDVEVIGGHEMMSMHSNTGVTIVSGEALDASTQESIKAVLLSVGRGTDVSFIDASGGADGRHVSIIKQKVEIVQ